MDSFLLTLFLIGVVCVIFEMLTVSFYLLIIGLSFIITSSIGYICNVLFNYDLGTFSLLIIGSVLLISTYFLLKKSSIMDRIYKSEGNPESDYIEGNTGLDGVGYNVDILVDSIDYNTNECVAIYKGAEWNCIIKLKDKSVGLKDLIGDTATDKIQAKIHSYSGIKIVVEI